jgi:hypothetical protein
MYCSLRGQTASRDAESLSNYASKYLSVSSGLQEADLVTNRRDGLWINYRLNIDFTNLYGRVLLEHLTGWVEEDSEIKALILKASSLDREVICRKLQPRPAR